MKQIITTMALILLGIVIFTLVMGTNPRSLKSKTEDYFISISSEMDDIIDSDSQSE